MLNYCINGNSKKKRVFLRVEHNGNHFLYLPVSLEVRVTQKIHGKFEGLKILPTHFSQKSWGLKCYS